ncbi:uncharacterized protein LOC101862232 [Aplysia californica]|uniref:Uncharacterized protein LOC101862232 n=1 Tax=Aplysia californica TaxID=6500 RepID=A0ABM1A004_APLCA|nr:uncharacterized protein LOC101862232 [Aplysia californica]XP_012938045.1 uncharacterized protein LOC101862232 [Aplysia californica]XP_012938049.1 uncharacterized protein LOC101862232 [Aplysia californica]
MAAIGFEVHVDKENATPAAVFNKGSVLKGFGPRRDKKLTQPTPRKALFDVNNDQQLSKKVGLGKESGLSGELSKPNKPGLKISSGVENKTDEVKKPEAKKVFRKKLPKKTKEPEADNKPPKVQPSISTKQPSPSYPDPSIPEDDEEYDSDSIFPRTERLSTYVDKLFSWRPPCLFGLIPDSESDLSDPNLSSDSLDIPMPEPEVEAMPEADLFSLLVPLPEVDASASESSGRQSSNQETSGQQARPSFLTSPIEEDSSLSLTPSPDTSLSLGHLQVMPGSLNTSAMEL